jgi:hypothetical protein
VYAFVMVSGVEGRLVQLPIWLDRDDHADIGSPDVDRDPQSIAVTMKPAYHLFKPRLSYTLVVPSPYCGYAWSVETWLRSDVASGRGICMGCARDGSPVAAEALRYP